MANPSDIRESFPSLEDATGAGVPLTKSLEGDAAAGKVGSTAFAYKDSTGNLVLPQLDSQGRVPVSSEGQGTALRTHNAVSGVLVGNGATYVQNVVLSIALVAAKNYGDMIGSVNCRRAAIFQFAYQDAGGTEVILDETVMDSGQYRAPIGLGKGDAFSVPASASSPKMIIRGGQFDKVSDMHASLLVVQF